MSLPAYMSSGRIEAGCDEAGRGCLAGPVFAAAVILPISFEDEWLNDSKQITESCRLQLRDTIEEKALAYAVAMLTPQEIDQHNILKSSFMAMHRAVSKLGQRPDHLLIDGNRFIPYASIDHTCVIKGDSKYASIAAASILAKTYRDEHMAGLHHEYPVYDWIHNKGYPTRKHRAAIAAHGASIHHRRSFKLLADTDNATVFNNSRKQVGEPFTRTNNA